MAPASESGGLITAISPQERRPHRRSVFIDGEFALSLDAQVVAALGLREGQRVDGALLAAAARQEEERRAREQALAYLAARPRTSQEVALRLGRRGYEPVVVATALAWLAEYRYLDDAAFAREFVRQRLGGARPQGPRRVQAELRKKGVDRDVAGAALAEGAGDPLELACQAGRSQVGRLAGLARPAAWRRLAGYLSRRGFGHEVVVAACRRLLGEGEDEP